MAVIPPTLKLITSALRRAEELEKDPSSDSKAVAYYCRYYCVWRGTKLCSHPPSADENKFLLNQMDTLERLKPSLDLATEKGSDLCKRFAMDVFNKADDIDQMGMADKATAKLFYSAGTFFDIMDQFGDLGNELLEKKKYAKWKATEILNAIRAGVKPTPGGSMPGDDAAGVPESSVGASITSVDIPAAPTIPPSAALTRTIPTAPNQSMPAPDYSQHYASPAMNTAPASYLAQTTAAAQQQHLPKSVVQVTPANTQMQYAAPPPQYSTPPVYNTDPRVKDTIELCQFAIASLNKNDLLKAKQRLQEALRRLE